MAPLHFLEGRKFHGKEAEVILGEILADNLGKKAGDTMEIQGASFRVVGVFRGGSALETGAVMMPIGQLQNLADLHGKVTAFHVRLHPAPPGRTAEEQIRQARAAIEEALPGLKAVPVAERAHSEPVRFFCPLHRLGDVADRLAGGSARDRQHHGHGGL